MVAEETRVVVIVNKKTQNTLIIEVILLGVVAVCNLDHVLCISENIRDCVVHRVVEKGSDIVLVWTNIGWVTIEALSHLENTRCSTIFSPEIFTNFWNGINTNTIKLILGNESLNPVLEVASDVRSILIKIWQVSKSAVLNLGLITPVIDLAVSVIVLSLVQWVNLRKVHTDWSDVVGNNINHHPNTLFVGLFNEVLEVLFGTEVGINLLPVSAPVTMVTWLQIVDNWRNPDSIKAHTFDIVKAVSKTVKGTAAIVGQVIAGTTAWLIFLVTIGEDLVNRALFPLLGVAGKSGSSKQSSSECLHSL